MTNVVALPLGATNSHENTLEVAEGLRSSIDRVTLASGLALGSVAASGSRRTDVAKLRALRARLEAIAEELADLSMDTPQSTGNSEEA